MSAFDKAYAYLDDRQEFGWQYGGAEARKKRENGRIWSDNDINSARFDLMTREAEWAHSEDMYNQYESPAALMRQYQEAGLNAALMYGGSTTPSAVDTSSTPGGVENTSPQTSGLDVFSTIMQMLTQSAQVSSGIADVGSQIKSRAVDNKVKQQNAETERYNAETNRMNAENETRKTDAFIQTSEVERRLKRSEINLNEKQTEVMEAQIVDYNSKVDARTQEVALKWYLANLEEYKFEFSKFKYNDTERPKSMAEIANLEAQAALSSAYEELAKTEAWAKANEVERENMLAENATRRLNHDMEMEDKRFAQDVAEWQQGVKDAKKQRIWNGVTSLVGSAASVFSGVAGVAGTLISSSAKRYATDRQFASDMIQATDRIRTKRTYEGRYDSKGQWHRTSGSYSTYD